MNKKEIKIDKQELIIFLEYLLDKVQEVYYIEAKQSIERFIERLK